MSSPALENSVSSPEPFGNPAPSGGLPARLAQWVALTERKRELESLLRPVQEQLTAMEPELLEDMALAGMKSATINGFTVYQQREYFCKAKEGVDKGTLIDRFRAAGLGHVLGGPNYQSMRSLSKEWAEAGESPPAVVAELMEMGENWRLRARKA